MLEHYNSNKTSPDILLFADTLSPIWYYENDIPQDSVYANGLGAGFKQFNEEEYQKYLEFVEEKSPADDRVHYYVDQAPVYASHHTTRTLASYKLAHELRKQGYTVQVLSNFWYFTEEDFKKVIDKFVGDNTLLVGFSATFHSGFNPWSIVHSLYMPPQRQRLFKKWINENNPDTKLIVGGNPTEVELLLDKSFDSAYQDMDIINVGYADVTIFEILDDIKKGQTWPTYVDKGSRLDIKNSTMSYCKEDAIQHGDEMPLELGRGCIFSCNFCNFGLIGKEKGSYTRNHSVIYDELKRNWEENGIYKYWVLDDTFNEDNDKLEVIAKLKADSNIPLELSAFLRLDLQNRLKQEQLLVDCGLKNPQYGIETLNPESAVAIGKGWHPMEQLEYLWSIKNGVFKDIWLFSHFIVGLPEDSRESLHEMKSILLDPKQNPLDHLYVNVLYIKEPQQNLWKSAGDEHDNAGGSKIDKDPAKFGYTFPNSKLNELQLLAKGSTAKYWRNKHGISFNAASKFQQQLNFDYNESRGFRSRQPTSWHKIPKDAKKSDWMMNYWDKYWQEVMNIQEHTKYNSVQWINDGQVTEFKPIQESL